jgi:hypothetical protein
MNGMALLLFVRVLQLISLERLSRLSSLNASSSVANLMPKIILSEFQHITKCIVARK